MPTRTPSPFPLIAVTIWLVLSPLAAQPSPVLTLEVPGRSNATPWVAASGSFVAVAWGATASDRTDVFVAVSRDGGGQFGAPVRVNAVSGEARLGGEMPPRVAVWQAAAGADPEIAVLWTARGAGTEIKIARSRDGGTTFDLPVTLQSAGAAGDRGWPALALDAAGVAHAVWLDHRGIAARRTAGQGRVRSEGHTGHDGTAMAQGSALYHAASGGESTVAERALTPGVCYCCKTALAVAPDGAIVAAWRHVYDGNLRDIAMAVSRDGGRSFSAPARVSEDGWSINGCPDDGPAMAVDAAGTVHIVWPTVIAGDDPRGALFYASTRDGVHATPRVRVPTAGGLKPSHPQVAIDAEGRVMVAWDESLDGRRLAAMREVKPAGSPPAFGPITTLAAGSLYPVLAATDRGVVAVWSSAGERSTIKARLY